MQRVPGAGSWTTSGVIGNDGMITCANKSARETGKPASAQNGPAMAGIPPQLGNSLNIEIIDGPHQQRNPPICYHQHQSARPRGVVLAGRWLESWIYGAINLARSVCQQSNV